MFSKISQNLTFVIRIPPSLTVKKPCILPIQPTFISCNSYNHTKYINRVFNRFGTYEVLHNKQLLFPENVKRLVFIMETLCSL
jgi:hypothetical protein